MNGPLAVPKPFTEQERRLIEDAARYLENPSLLMQLADAVGKPLEWILKAADKVAPGRVDEVIGGALRTALAVAVRTMPTAPTIVERPTDEIAATPSLLHKFSVALTGSVGGLFGVAGLALELPITTTIMLRSIAAIARDFGEDITTAEGELQCLTVFCLGGPAASDDAMDSAYLGARFGMQELVAQAAKTVAGLTAEQFAAAVQKGTAPALASLISKVAARFNLTVSQKSVVQAIPVLGAAAGATINVAFIDHFNRVARFHFGIRSLERKYGREVVQAAYLKAVRG